MWNSIEFFKTSSNVPNTLVLRDGTGGFSAGAINATAVTVSGNVTAASFATATGTADQILLANGTVVSSPSTAGQILQSNASGVAPTWVASSSLNVKSFTVQNASYSVLPNDYTVLMNATGGAISITLPAAASNNGRILVIGKADETNNVLTIAGGVLKQSVTTNITSINYLVSFTIQCDGTNWWIIGRN